MDSSAFAWGKSLKAVFWSVAVVLLAGAFMLGWLVKGCVHV